MAKKSSKVVNIVFTTSKSGQVVQDVAKVEKQLKGLTKQAKRVNVGFKESGASMGGFRTGGNRLVVTVGDLVRGFSALTSIFKQASGAALRLGIDFDKLNNKFIVLYKSQDRAFRKIRSAMAFAAKTPFDVEQVVNAFVQFKAFGVEADKVVHGAKVIEHAANFAFGMGRDLWEARTSIQYAVAANNWRSMQMRFATTKQTIVDTLKSSGYKPNLGTQGGREDAIYKYITLRFGGAMDKLSDTISVYRQNISDQFRKFYKAIWDESSKLGGIKGLLGAIMDDFQEMLPIHDESASGYSVASHVADRINVYARMLTKAYNSLKTGLSKDLSIDQNFDVIISNLGTAITTLLSSISEELAKINWRPLYTAVVTVFANIIEFVAKNLLKAIATAWKSVGWVGKGIMIFFAAKTMASFTAWIVATTANIAALKALTIATWASVKASPGKMGAWFGRRNEGRIGQAGRAAKGWLFGYSTPVLGKQTRNKLGQFSGLGRPRDALGRFVPTTQHHPGIFSRMGSAVAGTSVGQSIANSRFFIGIQQAFTKPLMSIFGAKGLALAGSLSTVIVSALGAAVGGWFAGKAIDKGVEKLTGKKLSTHIGDSVVNPEESKGFFHRAFTAAVLSSPLLAPFAVIAQGIKFLASRKEKKLDKEDAQRWQLQAADVMQGTAHANTVDKFNKAASGWGHNEPDAGLRLATEIANASDKELEVLFKKFQEGLDKHMPDNMSDTEAFNAEVSDMRKKIAKEQRDNLTNLKEAQKNIKEAIDKLATIQDKMVQIVESITKAKDQLEIVLGTKTSAQASSEEIQRLTKYAESAISPEKRAGYLQQRDSLMVGMIKRYKDLTDKLQGNPLKGIDAVTGSAQLPILREFSEVSKAMSDFTGATGSDAFTKFVEATRQGQKQWEGTGVQQLGELSSEYSLETMQLQEFGVSLMTAAQAVRVFNDRMLGLVPLKTFTRADLSDKQIAELERKGTPGDALSLEGSENFPGLVETITAGGKQAIEAYLLFLNKQEQRRHRVEQEAFWTGDAGAKLEMNKQQIATNIALQQSMNTERQMMANPQLRGYADAQARSYGDESSLTGNYSTGSVLAPKVDEMVSILRGMAESQNAQWREYAEFMRYNR